MKLSRHTEGIISRKLIHYSAAVIPLGYYYFLEKSQAVIFLLIASFVVVISDILRMMTPWGRHLYGKFFGWMTKRKEMKQEFTGASFLLVGSLTAVLIFPKNIAVISILFLTIGDPTACLVGTFLGKIKTFSQKTLEGTAGFILAGFLVTLLIVEIPTIYKLIAAIIAGIVEMLPIKIDDNFTVPITAGLLLLLLTSNII